MLWLSPRIRGDSRARPGARASARPRPAARRGGRSGTSTIARLLGVAALLVALAGPAAAQSRGKIAGTATDAATGEALIGVTIRVLGTSLGTASDVDGNYFVANLEVGTYDVQATYVGYDTLTVTGVRVTPNATATTDLQLRPSESQLAGDVVVTAERPLVERDNTTTTTRWAPRRSRRGPRPSSRRSSPRFRRSTSTTARSPSAAARSTRSPSSSTARAARNPLNYDPYTRINLSGDPGARGS